MKTLAALLFLVSAFQGSGGPGNGQNQGVPDDGGLAPIHARTHNLPSAHEITLGEGTRVGIISHSFGTETHRALYAGAAIFRVRGADPAPDHEAHQGFWMALALREIAPAAEIYALDLLADEESDRVRLIEKALDWAVEHRLDAITYCADGLSEKARKTLGPVLEKAVHAGVVVIFVDFPHPLNLLPAGFGVPPGAEEDRPDLKIFSYDCTTLLADQFLAPVGSDDDEISRNRSFLAPSSIGSLTAGLVALLRSVDPETSPGRVKEILIETSRPLTVHGKVEPNVPDAKAAISLITRKSPKKKCA